MAAHIWLQNKISHIPFEVRAVFLWHGHEKKRWRTRGRWRANREWKGPWEWAWASLAMKVLQLPIEFRGHRFRLVCSGTKDCSRDSSLEGKVETVCEERGCPPEYRRELVSWEESPRLWGVGQMTLHSIFRQPHLYSRIFFKRALFLTGSPGEEVLPVFLCQLVASFTR